MVGLPDPAELALRVAAESLVGELFSLIDRRDLAAASSLYAEDALFLGAHGRDEIRATMEKGLAASAHHRTRHVVANVRSSTPAPGSALVEYTILAYTLDGDGILAPRTILDQELRVRTLPDGSVAIAEHRIFGYDPN